MMGAPRWIIPLWSAVLVIALPSCGEKIKPSVLPGLDPSTLPQQESWNSTILLSDSGRIEARIHAGYIQKFQGPQETRMSEGIVVHFYNTSGQQTTTLTAREGKVNEQTNDLEALGNVVVVSDDSTRLRSERLFWDNRRNLIHTPDFVTINSPREKVQGHGFESDQRLRNYRIFRVTAQVRTD